jgi:branched-chain amino acid transport system substrate-binding protein
VKKRLTLSLSAVAVVATAAALSACSSSSSPSTSASTSGTSSTAASSTAASSTSAASGLKGTPYGVDVITELTSVDPAPEDVAGAQAAAAAVNASGGINGHPLVVSSCDAGSGASVTQAVTCGRNLVSSSALAEVGDFEIDQDQVNSVLLAAGVPNIGPPPDGQSVLSSSNSFPLSGSEAAALSIPLADAGAKKIWVAYVNSPEAAAALPFTKAVLAMSHPATTVLGGIPVDITTTDLTPDVTKGASGDGVAMAMIPAQLASWLTAAKQASATQKLSASASALLPSTLKALGSNANGLLVDSGLPFVTSSEPGVVKFRAEMAQYAPGQALDDISINAWLGTWAFAQVARTISGPVTRASVLSAFSHLTDFNVFGMLPAGFTTTKPFAFPGLGRLFNTETVTGVVKNGQLVQTSAGYVPVFTKS